MVCTALSMLCSCGHSHQPASEALQKAYDIQQAALQHHLNLDSQLTTLVDPEPLPQHIMQRKSLWLQDMIEIPDMAHDHAHCSHDHQRVTVNLSDEEMLIVQQAWLDTILQIRSEIEVLMTASDVIAGEKQ